MGEPHNARSSQRGPAKPADKAGHARNADKHAAAPASADAIRNYLRISRETQDRVTQLLTRTGAFHVK